MSSSDQTPNRHLIAIGLPEFTHPDPEPPATRACDLMIDRLEPCTPEAYREACHYQHAEIFRINRQSKERGMPKPGNQCYLREMEVQHRKYKLWTELKDDQSKEFWWFIAEVFGESAPKDWETFFEWFLNKLRNAPVANLCVIQELLGMAKELAFATFMHAKERNHYLERYPFAYDTIEDRYDHERYVAEAK